MISYRSPEVVVLTGMTYRQLDYAVTQGLLTPSVAEAKGSGTQRRFGPRDVAQARALVALRSIGVGGVTLQAAMAQITNKEPLAGMLLVPTTRTPFTSAAPYVTADLDDARHYDACGIVNLDYLLLGLEMSDGDSD